MARDSGPLVRLIASAVATVTVLALCAFRASGVAVAAEGIGSKILVGITVSLVVAVATPLILDAIRGPDRPEELEPASAVPASPTVTPAASNTTVSAGSCLGGEISLSRGSGPSGTAVTVIGTNWGAPGKRVRLIFGTTDMAPTRVEEGGRFIAEVVIPGDLDAFAPRQDRIRASVGGCSDSVPFQLEEPG